MNVCLDKCVSNAKYLRLLFTLNHLPLSYIYLAQVSHQGLRGTRPVAHSVLDLFSNHSEGLGPTLGDKHRVVPEAAVAMRFGGYGAFDDSVKDVFASAEHKDYDRAKPRSAASFGNIAQIVQQ